MNENLHNPELDSESFLWKAGPVGVFLSHGFTATAAEVRPLAERLHRAGYTVAGPLLPGHGTAPGDLAGRRWEEWIEAAEACYRELEAACETVFVGGESMGGLVALYLASQHPEAAGVLTYSPAVKLTIRPLDRLRLRILVLFRDELEKQDWHPRPGWQGYRVNPVRAVLQLLDLQKEVVRRLGQIEPPLLVVLGRKDESVDPRTEAILRNSVRSSVVEVHWMEESGHTVILDQELEAVTELTRRFMERMGPGDRSTGEK